MKYEFVWELMFLSSTLLSFKVFFKIYFMFQRNVNNLTSKTPLESFQKEVMQKLYLRKCTGKY